MPKSNLLKGGRCVVFQLHKGPGFKPSPLPRPSPSRKNTIENKTLAPHFLESSTTAAVFPPATEPPPATTPSLLLAACPSSGEQPPTASVSEFLFSPATFAASFSPPASSHWCYSVPLSTFHDRSKVVIKSRQLLCGLLLLP